MSGKLELELIMRLRDLASGAFTGSQRNMQSEIGRTQSSVDLLTRKMQGYERQTSTAIQKNDNLLAGVRRLANERGPVALINGLRTVSEQAARAQRMIEGMSRAAAGVAAAGYVISRPLNQTMDYGMRLAGMANTAFTDRNAGGRIAGKDELNSAIVKAVRYGGGTRDSAAETLDTLIASGAMSAKDAMGMLPTLVRSGTASGADPNQLAQIGIRGMQTFGIKPGEMGNAIDMAITAGQAGGFELKDMAKWLPQQMAAAKISGLSGTAGLAKLLAANQASAITAGSKDEAGNNLVNLLTKINSSDTAKDAQKQGINLSGTLAAARGKGMDGIDAFVAITDSIVGKDKNYQALQGKLKTAQGGDRKTILESQADILQGSAIGKIVQDRQALMALVGIMSNRSYMADVQKKTLAGAGATEKNFAVISAEAGFKAQQAGNEKVFATQNAFEKLAPMVSSTADWMTSMARQYPVLTAAVMAATTALTALAAAAAASGVAGLLTGRGGGALAQKAGGSLLTRLGVTAAFAGGSSLTTMAGLGASGLATIAGGVGVAGAAGYGVGSLVNKGIEGTAFADSLGRSIARALAFMGSAEARQSLKVEVDVKNGNIVAAVNQANARQASRH
ncbi:tail tape measure protein [Sulfuriferula sp. AH1]|uniref:phage tail tape measure protein n=1 Tax=Sulfuriferula sp. AH1 TaxID=1985873 RepID=UPI000B3B3ECA|nr:phage tail tape measure protein [Sulfuriferula sp. AH1]ARU30902.1 tail tape measure protein [Sulfuriferula sp. AH1]